MNLDRRRFLAAGGSLVAGSILAPAAGARLRWFPGSGDATAGRTLVLVQLTGGNDGLSTVVPYADDDYRRVRKTIRLDEPDVLPLEHERGFHGALRGLRSLYDGGRLAVVEGVGYPDSPRSHFKSLDVWHTASASGRAVGEGWIPRLVREVDGADGPPERVVHVGKNVPYSLHSAASPPVAFEVPESYRWFGERPADSTGEAGGSTGNPALDRLRGVREDAAASSKRIREAARAYRTQVEYPNTAFGRALRVAAALIDARLGGRVVSVELGGFDTHRNQRDPHDRLMRTLDQGLAAFTGDLNGRTADDETLVVVFSEFGRRVAENGSRGTDHGKAGPMFVLGAQAKGGFHGETPRLDRLDDGDVPFTTDFRSVYATLCERWFGANAEEVLGARYPRLDLVRG